jgi:hypothetical protein
MIDPENRPSSPDVELETPKNALRSLLGGPRLLQGEDPREYDQLYEQIMQATGPLDPFEEIYVDDFVNLLWERRRLLDYKNTLIKTNYTKGLRSLLAPLISDEEECSNFVNKVAQGDPKKTKELHKILKKHQLSEKDIVAHTFNMQAQCIEFLDSQFSRNEYFRTKILKEICHHRETLGALLRREAESLMQQISLPAPYEETAQ